MISLLWLLTRMSSRAQEVQLRWSPNGQAVLVHTHTDVDTSGESYYGSTGTDTALDSSLAESGSRSQRWGLALKLVWFGPGVPCRSLAGDDDNLMMSGAELGPSSRMVGAPGLYLLHADGGYDCTVPLGKEGPIADAQWAPGPPAQFVVIAGRVPAMATLFNVKVRKRGGRWQGQRTLRGKDGGR
jgi:hypothetical protein